MTKTEILEKIDKGLRGQGNQVDIGNVLADVLTEIVDGGPTLTITNNVQGYDLTKEEFAANLGITETEVDNLFRGDYKTVRINSSNSFMVLPLIVAYLFDDGAGTLIFGGQDENFGVTLYVDYDEGAYNIGYAEV